MGEELKPKSRRNLGIFVLALGLIVVALGWFWKYDIIEAKNNVYNLIRSNPFMEKEELDALNTQRRMLNEQLVVAEVTVILGIVLIAIGVLIFVHILYGKIDYMVKSRERKINITHLRKIGKSSLDPNENIVSYTRLNLFQYT